MTEQAHVAALLQRIPKAIEWCGGADGRLRLLDQTRLPAEAVYLDCGHADQVYEAIRMLRVRGAPAIGVAGAFALFLYMRAQSVEQSAARLREQLAAGIAYLAGARPTAVNLAWALRRVGARAEAALDAGADRAVVLGAVLDEASAIANEDAALCTRIGSHGAALVPDGGGVLTHCNAGALATAGIGTALAALYVAHARGKRFRVFADETRPLLQGARLTAYELGAAGLDVTVLCDGAAASLLASGVVDMVIVGADRIAANGDVANKIGTYGVAVAAQRHGVPFYVAAPHSTFDLSIPNGAAIPIEQRGAEELGSAGRTGMQVWNPAFDVTPAELVRAIITDRGVLQPVSADSLRRFFH